MPTDTQVFENFKTDFPNADFEYFEASFGEIFYKHSSVDSYSILSDTFWSNQDAVKHLNLTGDDVYIARAWREKFPKVKRILSEEKQKMMKEFHLKHPTADLKDYQFEVLLNDDLSVKSKTIYHQSSSEKKGTR